MDNLSLINWLECMWFIVGGSMGFYLITKESVVIHGRFVFRLILMFWSIVKSDLFLFYFMLSD